MSHPPDKEWDGGDAFLIGGGPSLKNFNFSLLEGMNVIGCNDAYRLGSKIVKYGAFGDANWWHKNKWNIEQSGIPFVTNAPSVLHMNIPNMIRMNRERDGIHSGNTLGWNYSTGALAINIAINLGAIRIFLLGYDITSQGKESHWHAYNERIIPPASFDRFLKGFAKISQHLPEGVQVFNVTDGSSRLHCFPRIIFEDFYGLLGPRVLQEVT